MPTNITMPALSPTMEEGNLAKWLKKEGDVIKSGDVLCEIETDKATMEVEAVDEGTLLKIVVPEGTQGVKVNAVIAVIGEAGEKVEAQAAAPGAAAAAAPSSGPAGHLLPAGEKGTPAPAAPPSPPRGEDAPRSGAGEGEIGRAHV